MSEEHLGTHARSSREFAEPLLAVGRSIHRLACARDPASAEQRLDPLHLSPGAQHVIRGNSRPARSSARGPGRAAYSKADQGKRVKDQSIARRRRAPSELLHLSCAENSATAAVRAAFNQYAAGAFRAIS